MPLDARGVWIDEIRELRLRPQRRTAAHPRPRVQKRRNGSPSRGRSRPPRSRE